MDETMYQAHFQLNGFPFANTPDVDLFYPGGNRGAILRALIYAIESGEGIVKVVGEVGSGKTMLCRMLAANVSDAIEIVYLANPSLTANNILHAIALELKMPVDFSTPKLEILNRLHQYLLKKHVENKQVVVLVEESQAMPLETLEEIRLLSNLETHKRKLIQIVLFGQPELDKKIECQSMRQLKERISYSFHIEPFSTSEVSDYLTYRLSLRSFSGINPFTHKSMKLIARYSEGLVRRVNFLADKTLLAAFSENTHVVTPKHVRKALKECEFRTSMRQVLTSKKLIAVCVASSLTIGAAFVYSEISNGVPTIQPKAEVQQAERVNGVKSVDIETAVLPTSSESERRIHEGDVISERMHATRLWLDSVNERYYTVQILTAVRSSENEMAGLAKILNNPVVSDIENELYIHDGILSGRPVLVLTLGGYEGYSVAKQAIDAIPESLRKYQPLIRTISSLKKEIAHEK